MPGVTDLVEQINKLDPVEREQLLARFSPGSHHISRSASFAGIVRTPGICGGAARFIRTRIPVWSVIRMQQLGASDVDFLRSYPNLRAVDLAEAWAFSNDHREEIEKDIRENEEE
jgi:uncharacterized protein (DUF433 family)